MTDNPKLEPADARLGGSSVSQVAERNHISIPKVYAEIRDGRLRARKVGHRTVIFAVDELAWQSSLPELVWPNPASSRMAGVRKEREKRRQARAHAPLTSP